MPDEGAGTRWVALGHLPLASAADGSGGDGGSIPSPPGSDTPEEVE